MKNFVPRISTDVFAGHVSRSICCISVVMLVVLPIYATAAGPPQELQLNRNWNSATASTEGFAIPQQTLDNIEQLKKQLRADPQNIAVLSQLGIAWLDTARQTGGHDYFHNAEMMFSQLKSVHPLSHTAPVGLAYALIGQHRFKESLEAAHNAAYLAPEASEVIALLGDIHFALGNYMEAEVFFEKLERESLTLQSLSRISLIHEHRGRMDEAEKAMREAFQAGQLLDAGTADLAWTRNMLGDLANRQGQSEKAKREYQEALTLNPDACHAALALAKLQTKEGQFQLAEKSLTDLVAKRPLPTFWIALGDLYTAKGDKDKAMAWYRKAEEAMVGELEKKDYGHVRELVEFWLERDKNPKRCVELALFDLHEVRHDVAAYETAAWALHKAGRNDEAVDLIQQALRRSRSDARTLNRASQILSAAGRPVESKYFERLASQRNPLSNEFEN